MLNIVCASVIVWNFIKKSILNCIKLIPIPIKQYKNTKGNLIRLL